MQYLKMLPYQVREAIEKNVPVVFPLGVVRFDHLRMGSDVYVALNGYGQELEQAAEVCLHRNSAPSLPSRLRNDAHLLRPSGNFHSGNAR